MISLTKFFKKWLATSTPRQKLAAGLLFFSLLATGAFYGLSDSSGRLHDPLGSASLYFFGVFVKLIGVLLLIVASAIIFRRWSNFSPAGNRVRHLRLLETVRLSPKQSLHLLSVGDQQILIGATDQTIALIAPVDRKLEINPVESSHPQPGQDFASLLQAFTGHFSIDSGKGNG